MKNEKPMSIKHLLDWIFKGKGNLIKYFIGQPHKIKSDQILINSENLFILKLKKFKICKFHEFDSQFHEIFFYINNEVSILNEFNKFKEKMKPFLRGPIFLREKFVCTQETKNILVEKRNDFYMNDGLEVKYQIYDENIDEEPLNLINFYGTFVILNVHTLLFKNFMILHSNSKKLKNYGQISQKLERIKEPQKKKRKKNSFFELKKQNFKFSKIIGQFNKQFILISIKNKIFIIDQHALSERILLENGISIDKACRNAFKFNDELCFLKMKQMIMYVDVLNEPFICCHGRPSVLFLMEL